MPKLKTKSTLKKRARMTASGLVKVKRQGHHHFLRRRSKRALRADSKGQYVNKNMQKQIKLQTPYGLHN